MFQFVSPSRAMGQARSAVAVVVASTSTIRVRGLGGPSLVAFLFAVLIFLIPGFLVLHMSRLEIIQPLLSSGCLSASGTLCSVPSTLSRLPHRRVGVHETHTCCELAHQTSYHGQNNRTRLHTSRAGDFQRSSSGCDAVVDRMISRGL